MRLLNLPVFAYRIRPCKTGHQIFDVVRKKYVQLTAEEWVRQHFLHYLINHLGYPSSLVRLEQHVRYNHLAHRPDIVVYNRSIVPLMLVECKAAHIAIKSATREQIARYNAHFRAQFLVITNGVVHYCWQFDDVQGNHTLLTELPHFEHIV